MFVAPTVNITVPVIVIQTHGADMKDAPARMQAAFQQEVTLLRPQFLIVLKPRGAHKRPTIWTSEKQRRWWFAVGRKTWSGRTGAQERGYRVESRTSLSGGNMVFYNVNPSSVYVQGRLQQPMHRGTWPTEDEAILDFRPIAQERIRQTAIRVFAGRGIAVGTP